jgi:hypothetical protein
LYIESCHCSYLTSLPNHHVGFVVESKLQITKMMGSPMAWYSYQSFTEIGHLVSIILMSFAESGDKQTYMPLVLLVDVFVTCLNTNFMGQFMVIHHLHHHHTKIFVDLYIVFNFPTKNSTKWFHTFQRYITTWNFWTLHWTALVSLTFHKCVWLLCWYY